MQTFMPYDSFILSASCLDNKRLGKQRVECKQIYQALLQGPLVMYDVVLSMQVFGKLITDSNIRYKKRKTAWYNHPATQMWKGYEYNLVEYSLCICDVWIHRGFKDTLYDYFCKQLEYLKDMNYSKDYMPLRNIHSFHESHQSNLVRKDNTHYRKYFPDVKNNLPYVWSLPK